MITKQVQELGIDIPNDAIGDCRTTCPQCSEARSKMHLKCLATTITETGAVGFCHHCGYKFRIGVLGTTVSGKKIFQTPEYEHDESIDPAVGKWFSTRGISEEVLKRNKVGYKKIWMPQTAETASAVSFPYLRGGDVVNVKYRDDQKNFRMEHGAELILYGLDDIDGDTLVWVEGEVDKLSAEMAGITSCVSVPNGAPPVGAKNFERHFNYLDSVDLSRVRKHVIAVDNDEPGRQLKAELVRRLDPEKCYIIDWPDGSKDANEVLVKHGVEVLKGLLTHPRPFPLVGVVEANDVLGELLDLNRNGGYQRGELPGTAELAKYFTVVPGQMTIVTGIPSHGKSSWVDWLCYSLAKGSGWQFAVCSPENQPVRDHVVKFIEMHQKRSFFGMTPDAIQNGVDWVGDHFTFISPNDENITDWSIDGVLNLAKPLVFRKGIKGLIIDPWNEFDHSRRDGMSETEHISQCLSKVRRFAIKHGVHVWIVAHPTKLRNDEKTGKQSVPTLYDIAGSAHFYNKADIGVTVWRDIENPQMPVLVDVKKVRFKWVGERGTAEMSFDLKTNTYQDYQEPEGTF